MVFALHPHQDRFVTGSEDAVVLAGVDARVATLFPLVETALQITLDAGDVLGETVVVVGLGSVGLLTGLLLERAGARVLGVDPSAWRRGRAAELGLDAVVPDDVASHVRENTVRAGIPLVIEVSGNPDALVASLPLLAQEGTALVASWYGTKPVTLDLGREFHRRRLTIRSTQVSSIPARLSSRWTLERRRQQAAELLTELPLKALATHEFPFERAADAFEALDRGDESMLHAALVYDES